MTSYDVAIIGLGAMGSAAAYHLAKRGASVIGFDRFTPPHTMGSSHGDTRIIREAYHESPAYVPIVQRSYELWAELEQEAGETLLRQTGGVMIGPPEGETVAGARRSAELHGLTHELLGADEIRRRWPQFNPPDDFAAIYEDRSGILFPEKCISAHLAGASGRGAELRYGTQVSGWTAVGDGVTVNTDGGSVSAGRLLITAGAWLPGLVSELDLKLEIERQVLFWFEPAANRELFDPANCPIYIWEYELDHAFYGFPNLGDGVKIARHHDGRIVDPDALDRDDVSADDEQMIRVPLCRVMPDAAGRVIRSEVCMYTNTADHHYLVGFHPEHPSVLIGSPCSGHGFKMASALGEAFADMLLDGRSRHDLTPFGIERLLT